MKFGGDECGILHLGSKQPVVPVWTGEGCGGEAFRTETMEGSVHAEPISDRGALRCYDHAFGAEGRMIAGVDCAQWRLS